MQQTTTEISVLGAIIKRSQFCNGFDEFYRLYLSADQWSHCASECSFNQTWANQVERKLITYCEGDIVTLECDTDELFQLECQRSIDFYKQL